jgi:hypothetical protein
MTYQDLIKTISEIVDNENIVKEGLTLIYELDPENHEKMDEHLFYKVNDRNAKFEHQEIIELEIEGLIINIIKKTKKIAYEDVTE